MPASTTIRVAALVLLGVTLTACASSGGSANRWTAPPGVTLAKQDADDRACKRKADEDAMRRVISPSRVGADTGRYSSNPMTQADRVKANNAFRRYYNDCMLALGYTPKAP